MSVELSCSPTNGKIAEVTQSDPHSNISQTPVTFRVRTDCSIGPSELKEMENVKSSTGLSPAKYAMLKTFWIFAILLGWMLISVVIFQGIEG